MSRLRPSLFLAGFMLASVSLPVSAASDCVPKDIFFTDRIDLRKPGQRLGQKAAGLDKVYLYVAMDCARADRNEKYHVRWFLNGKLLQALAIPLGVSSNWRTSSYATARRGTWKVELSWDSGAVFATQEIGIE
jgi:hypothetical protein